MTGLAVWFVLGTIVAVVLGRGIRLADDHAAHAAVPTTADLPTGFVAVA